MLPQQSLLGEFSKALLVLSFGCLAACDVRERPPTTDAPEQQRPRAQLPTGVSLDPAEPSVELGSMPLAVVVHPAGRELVVLLNGWREQGIQVFDRASRRVVQTVRLPAVFLGVAFNRAGDTLFVSGGYRDLIYEFAWEHGRARLVDSIPLVAKAPRRLGQRYPAGIALSSDGRSLYVAENLTDSLAVIDIARQQVTQRLPLGRYPYAVVATRGNRVFVSAWGDTIVSSFTAVDGRLVPGRAIAAGRHPSALLLDRGEARLFIASASMDRVGVFDVATGTKLAELRDPPPAGPAEGSTPNALALSPDERRLFVAEADNNAVAIFDLGAGKGAPSKLAGRVPVDWYPTALAALDDSLVVVSGKGHGTAQNPDGPTPYKPREQHPKAYTLGQLNGSLMVLSTSQLAPAALATYTSRVERANGWNQPRRTAPTYPAFEHVIYVIKENRTYDEVLGDLSQADGDSSLAVFPRANTPNHHALAERFGIFDRFFVNAEVSADGHNWSMAAYATDYVEKTVASHYSARGRTYDYEGTNRGVGPRVGTSDDVAEPASGYLWNLAERAHITFRDYGEYVSRDASDGSDGHPRYVGNKPFLAANMNRDYPGFDLDIPDQYRTDIWVKDLERDSRRGTMAQLEIVRLPNDHTAALKAGAVTPRSMLADNDLALGRMIEALSRSPFWKSTVVFVLEDDAQNGPDHVDSHRSELFVISPYNAPGVYRRFTNTSDVVATIAEILHLGSLSQFDYYGRPLRDIFSSQPNLQPYSAVRPAMSLTERNPQHGVGAERSKHLDLSAEDRGDDDLFNEILWRALKGSDVPYPGARRASVLELRRGQ
ncbi:MAG TPA: bifunctional YncE family protein/alkaline phosphatase family protein [Gemmatimonadaceae bacterium]